MVTSKNRFIIDATFVVERAHETFFGAPLMAVSGKDHTFAFGCVRDFLRLRLKLGIQAGVLVIGKEAYSYSNRDAVLDLIAILEELKIPHIHEPRNSGLHVTGYLCSKFSHIITADKRFLQLCADDLLVILPREGKKNEWDWMSPEVVKTAMGIFPKDVPTYIALTDPSSPAAMTSKQATRLIELYGDIDSLYSKLDRVVSLQVRAKLAEGETRIRHCYTENKCRPTPIPVRNPNQYYSLNDLDTANSRKVLTKYDFRSLLTLLAIPLDIRPDTRVHRSSVDSYHAVVDRKGMQNLASMVCASKLCSIDTETDGKDPREATLLGVSFSVKDREAFFIPLNEADLKDLTKDEVLKVLQRIFDSDVDFIGHNIKYDYLILRRSGVVIKRIHFDTMLAAYECHTDWPFFNLPYVCKRYLGETITPYTDVVSDGSTFLDLPLREMVNHACQDAEVTRRLYPVLLAQLHERGIMGQYMNYSMQQLQRLANLEFDGMALDVGQLDEVKKNLVNRATHLRADIFRMVGKVFDIESNQALSQVLREIADAQGYIGPSRMTVSALEHLAIVEPVARHIVKMKRLRSQVGQFESISAAARNGKIYSLFNLMTSRTGLLTSIQPSLFDIEETSKLKSCFDNTVRDLFVDTNASLNKLAEVTKDPVLLKVRKRKSKVDLFITEHPLVLEVDHDEFLLRLAIGQSDTVLSKRFLVDRYTIAKMRQDFETRYQIMFQWLRSFGSASRTKGFATNGDLRKCVDGLKSSDVARREQALEHVVRWLIRY